MSDHELTPDEVTSSIDRLIDASSAFERKLDAAGVPQAHELMFAVREILLDLRRLNLKLAEALSANPGSESSAGLDAFAKTFLFEVVPHVEGHLTDLRRELGTDDSDQGIP